MMNHAECITLIVKFKTSMLRSNLCDYSAAYNLVKGTMSITQVLAPGQPENIGKNVVFKNVLHLLIA